MANPAESEVQNLLPVQAYFDVQGNFQTFIGQGKPFTATISPIQSGLQITNSTINSSVIGGITPAAANFTTATVLTQPVGATDVVNLLALQSYAAGISWKQPCVVATLANITLSGLQTIDGHAVVAGDRVLVKNQSTAADNGIYLASASAWTRSLDANTWDELIAAISFIEYGTQAGGAWFCTAQDGGTLGVTAVNWSQFTTSATYSAGTGLTLTGSVFSITPVGTASTYGSASTVPVFTTNASGQVSSVTNTNIAIGATQITSGTIDSARLSGSYSGITGLGTLTDLTVTNAIVGSITGNAATATTAGSATTAGTATNLAGGSAGSLPYQTASGATGFLAAGTNGQILALASGIPSWIDNQVGTVTSVSGTGTVNGLTLTGTVTSSGSLTLGGTLDLSSPPAIGGTTANTVRGTTVTATSSFVGTNFDASGSGGGSLRNLGGSACLQWGGGGGVNVTIDGAINMNGANSAIQINPTGTGTVSIAPAGALTVNPTTASTMNNVAIGGTTPLAGTFTDLRFNGTLSAAGSTGTSGHVLTSNGASAPTWQALPASSITVTDNTSSASTYYPAITTSTSGSIGGVTTSSTKMSFVPSTGILSVTGLNASGLTASSAVATDASKNLVSVTNTGTGNNVLATSPTIASPIITGSTPQITVYTSGSGTYTVPTNARWLQIKMCGGGGGGSGSGTAVGPSYGGAGGNGGNTTFGSSFLTCNGGSGGTPAGGASVSGSGGSSTISAGATGVALVGGAGVGVTLGDTIVRNGCAGGVNFFGGGGGLGTASSTTATPNTGAGGVGGLANGGSVTFNGTGGGAGGCIEAIITSPSSTYSYAVGSGGSGGTAGSGQNTGTAGFSGVIIVTAYF